jgi:aldehyde dehydrogenase (NAD+)
MRPTSFTIALVVTFPISGEIGIAITEALTAYRNVEKWSKPEHPPFSLNFAAMRPVIRKEPKGLVLIITPFNYPVFLSFSPVVRTTCI